LDVSATVFEMLMHKARKRLVFPTTSLFDSPVLGNVLEFLDETSC